jgi:hypothetical protein
MPDLFEINSKNAPDLWAVQRIANPDGTDRTDGRYPQRVGCTVVVLYVKAGGPLVWSYLADAGGGEKSGVRASGRINSVFYDAGAETLYAESKHSRYWLKKLPLAWGETYADRVVALPDWYPDICGPFVLPVPLGKLPDS